MFIGEEGEGDPVLMSNNYGSDDRWTSEPSSVVKAV